MSPNEPSPERLERMKQVLAASYPKVPSREREPLPASVLKELRQDGAPRRADRKSGHSFLQLLLSFLRGPQAIGLGAVAVLVVAAILFFRPGGEGGGTGGPGGGDTMRSGGGPVSGPPVVVMHGLAESQVVALRESGYFRAEQLVEVPAGGDLESFLSDRSEERLVVVDGIAGTISAAFEMKAGPSPVRFTPGDADLASMILDFLAKLPKDEPEREEDNE